VTWPLSPMRIVLRIFNVSLVLSTLSRGSLLYDLTAVLITGPIIDGAMLVNVTVESFERPPYLTSK
jgi:hypothetical protein